MSMIKILHTADLHLDSPFDGLPSGKAAQRRQEQRALLSKIAQTARDEGVQAILLAGDLLDSDSACTETAEELISVLKTVSVPVFIAPGNHDFYSSRSPYAKLKFPENVHIFRENSMECVDLPELNARVFGAAFTDKYSRPLLRGFAAEKKFGVTDIMCLHGDVGAAESQYDPISERDIAESGMNYIALGHIHKCSGLRRSGSTYYAWPGCPEGRGFDETGEKSIYIVSLSDGECSIKPVQIAGRKYEILTVELDGVSPLEAIKNRLDDDTENDIYRIILRGESAQAPDIAALKRTLESRFYSLQMRDETVLVRDVWDGAGEDSLRGQFLIRLRRAYENAGDEQQREKIVQAARWGLAALEGREEVLRHDY